MLEIDMSKKNIFYVIFEGLGVKMMHRHLSG